MNSIKRQALNNMFFKPLMFMIDLEATRTSSAKTTNYNVHKLQKDRKELKTISLNVVNEEFKINNPSSWSPSQTNIRCKIVAMILLVV